MFQKILDESEKLLITCHKTIRSIPAYILLTFFFLLSLLTFTINNTHEQIWYGEALSLYLTDFPVDEMVEKLRCSGAESNPPLYFLMLKTVRKIFSDSLFVLRLFSGVCGALLVSFFFYFIQRIFSKPIAVAGSLLVILNPVIIQFSQEIRMYMLASFLLCIIQFSFYFAAGENRLHYWLIYTTATIAGIYTHYYLLFSIPANLIFFVFLTAKPNGKSFVNTRLLVTYIITQAVIFIAYLPWIPTLIQQAGLISTAEWIDPLKKDTLFDIISFFFTTKFSCDINPLVPYPTVVTATVFFVFYLIFCMTQTKIYKEKIIFLFISGFTPVLSAITFSFVKYSIINLRYFIPWFPFLATLLVCGISAVEKKTMAAVIYSLFILAAIPTLSGVYTYKFNGAAEDTANYLHLNCNSDEPVITFENNSFLTLNHYIDNPSRLFFYSDKTVRAYQGATLFSDKIVNHEKLSALLQTETSFIVVLTPDTKEYSQFYLEDLLSNFYEDTSLQKTFKYPKSWFRTRVIRYYKSPESLNR